MSDRSEASEVMADDLARQATEDDVEIAPPLPVGFVCDTPSKAEWLTSTLLSSEGELVRREAELARWKKQHERLELWAHALLDEFYEKNPPSRGKTIHLANGVVSKRTVAGGLRITDEKAVKAWARKHLPAALIPAFEENLDKQIAMVGLEKLYAAELEDAFAKSKAMTTDEVAAFDAALATANAKLREVGAIVKNDEERIYVKAPRAPRRS